MSPGPVTRPGLPWLGSPLADERRGRPRPAREAAEQAAAGAGTAEGRAWALVDAGLGALQAGEPRRALRLLDQVPGEATAPVRALAAAYRNAAVFADSQWFPDGLAAPEAVEPVADLVPEPDAADLAVAVEAQVAGLAGSARSARTTAALERSMGRASQVAPLFEQQAGTLAGIAGSIGWPGAVVWLHVAAAQVWWRAGDAARAEVLAGEAVRLAQEAGDPVALAGVVVAVGDAIVGEPEGLGIDLHGRPAPGAAPDAAARAQAGALYAQAAQLYGQAGAAWGLAAVAHRSAALAWLAGDHATCAEQLLAAEQGYADVGDEARRRLARVERVAVAVLQGDAGADPAAVVDEAASWALDAGSRSWAMALERFLVAVGRRGRDEGRVDAALGLLGAAARLQQHLGDEAGRPQLLRDLAEVHDAFGQRAAAIAALEEAADLARAAVPAGALAPGSPAWMAAVEALVLFLGTVNQQVRLMAPEGLASRVERAMALADRVAGDAAASTGPTPVELDPTRLPADLAGFGQALVARTVEDLRAQLRVMPLLYRAVALEDAGGEGAGAVYDEALAAACAAGDGGFLEGTVLGHLGRYPEAASAFDRWLADRGAAWSARDELELRVTVLDWPRAAAALARLEQEAGPRWWEHDLRPWEGLALLAELAEGEGDLARAIEAARAGAAAFEARLGLVASGVHRTALADNRLVRRLHLVGARIAGRLAAAALAGGDGAGAHDRLDECLAFLERSRSRSLVDLIATARHFDGAGDQAFRAWLRAAGEAESAQAALAAAWTGGAGPERRAALDAEADQAVADRVAALDRLRAARPDADEVVRGASAAPVPLAAVQATLPSGVLLLEYGFGADVLEILAVSPRGAAVRSVPVPTARLRHLLGRVHLACRPGAPPAAYSPVAEQAAALLLDPVADLLDRHRRVVVVPFGAIHAVPVHALPRSGVPLGASHVVSYLPAASLLVGARPLDAPVPAGGRLAVGDPTGMRRPDGAPASRLPHAGLEARYVAHLAGADALVGAAATEAAVRDRLPAALVLHAATHGLVDTVAPLRSSVLLAHGEHLTVSELIGLQLRAELVVLSACETGLGAVTSGDDVLGLARGVLASGARGAVVSLWPVRDDVACVVMARFHELLAGGTAPAAALHAAQLAVRGRSAPDLADDLHRLARLVGGEAAEVGGQLRVIGGGAAPSGAGGDHPGTWAPFVYVGT